MIDCGLLAMDRHRMAGEVEVQRRLEWMRLSIQRAYERCLVRPDGWMSWRNYDLFAECVAASLSRLGRHQFSLRADSDIQARLDGLKVVVQRLLKPTEVWVVVRFEVGSIDFVEGVLPLTNPMTRVV